LRGDNKNHATLKPIVDWMMKLSTKGAPKRVAGSTKAGESTAMKLADEGHFWVGFEHKRVQNDSATALAGTTYVQYLKPAKKRSPYPIILVHGGAGQGTHFMGLNGMAGWAHYFVQAGYDTYVIDRPGHGRAVYHPDFYGEATPVFTFQSVLPLINEGAKGRWMGSGDLNDPLVLQFQAGQNSIPKDLAVLKKYYETGAGQLLDKIGPSIILAHSMGGPWPYVAAATRPGKVKAILDVEGMSPFGAPWNVSTDSLKNIPIACVQAEKSSIKVEGTVARLKEAGCNVEAVNLKDKGVAGNGHFMMFENNRKQVFDTINAWLESKIKA
jgi:alpha-beta hydrolase superfamily lysophospholipase